MEKQHKIKIGITHGDTNGVGYEVILKTFSDPLMADLCVPVVYGSQKAMLHHRKALQMDVPFHVVASADEARANHLNLIDCFGGEDIKVELGRPTQESGQAAFTALERAVADWEEGAIDAIVTCPISKKNIQSDRFRFVGHTEYLQSKMDEGDEALMILMNPSMRVALATTHLPLQEVSRALTTELITRKLDILHQTLKTDFMISTPRIAVLALNPHSGDDGLLGTEEETVIKPAIVEARSRQKLVFGPYSADGFFGAAQYKHFDAVLAMYHDQGLAPFKALSMNDGVNYTAGLHVVRTSPDHGTAFDIAGKGQASEVSMRQAVYAAIDIVRHRETMEEAGANPLHIVNAERDSKSYTQRRQKQEAEDTKE